MLLRDEGWAVPAPPVESLDLSTRQGQAEQCGAHPLSQTWSAGCLQELWVPVLLWILMAPTGHPRPASRALQINLMAGVPASAPMGRVRLGVTLSVCVCGGSHLDSLGERAESPESRGGSHFPG